MTSNFKMIGALSVLVSTVLWCPTVFGGSILDKYVAEHGMAACAAIQAALGDAVGNMAVECNELNYKKLSEQKIEENGQKGMRVSIAVTPFKGGKEVHLTLCYKSGSMLAWTLTGMKVEHERTVSEGQTSAEMGNLFEDVALADRLVMAGRFFFVSITQANTERVACGLTSAWPQNAQTTMDDKNDIAEVEFKTATSYFHALFDFKNRGKSSWAPYVNQDSFNAVFAENLKPLWCIAKGGTDEMDENIPVLVSANVDVSSLVTAPGKYNTRSLSGNLRFSGEWAAIVYKSGAATVVKKGSSALQNVYKNATFVIPQGLSYLSP